MTENNSEEYTTDENKYFKITHNTKTNKYTVYAKKEDIRICKNADYAYTSADAPKHVEVKKDGKWTLYDSNGEPEQYAQNVDHLDCRNDNHYWIRCYGKSWSKCYTRQGKMRNTIMKTCLSLTGLAILGGLAKCTTNSIQEEKALDKTPATYLGSQEGHFFFDTDGNKATAEVVAHRSSTTDNIAKRFNTHIQPEETRLISEWKDLGYFKFERIKQDKQNER